MSVLEKNYFAKTTKKRRNDFAEFVSVIFLWFLFVCLFVCFVFGANVYVDGLDEMQF